MSASVSKCIDKKNRLFILSKSKPTLESYVVYKIYHNRLATVLRKAERDYYCDQLEITILKLLIFLLLIMKRYMTENISIWSELHKKIL